MTNEVMKVMTNEEMTNKDAIIRLKNIDIRNALQEDYDALDMAIKALEQQPSEDCISRAEAINVVHKYFVNYLKLNDDICLDGIRSLPSVTPTISKMEQVEDCISRDAVDELSKALVHTTRDKADFLCNFWERLQKLPPVTPHKRGKWLDKKTTIKGGHGLAYGRYGCSVCKKKQPSKTDFCPNCGADMRESEDKE